MTEAAEERHVTKFVRRTPELLRILHLPRRPQKCPEGIQMPMSEALKTDEGEQTLREVQAFALHDIAIHRGLFGPIGVGEGKTLITLLASYVLEGKRVLLLLPATLKVKTERELKKYRQNWLVPTNIKLFSIELLGRVQAEKELEIFDPDVVIVDEAQRVKNPRAACTRRVDRFMDKKPDTIFIALSGTVMRKSILDFAHILRWCLKDQAPVPKTYEECMEWALALDEGITDEARFEPGALLDFASEEDLALVEQGLMTKTQAARRGFQKRLLETPGVVSAMDGENVGASLRISAIQYKMSKTTDEHFKRLREEMITPDDWELMTGAEVWMHARQLALGYHSAWEPRPPEPWLEARRNWNCFVRDVLSKSRTLDSPEQVANCVDRGEIDDGGTLTRWRAIKPTFPINVVAHWHDDAALKVCLEWMKKPGIVWVSHIPFGERLAQLSGCKYYGARGYAPDGSFIEDASIEECAIASLDANKEGRNLQQIWNRNLYTAIGSGADEFQQSIARTHRPELAFDEVSADILIGCAEHIKAWRQVLSGAQAIYDMTGDKHKVLYADIDMPTDDELDSLKGPRWGVERASAVYTNSRWEERFASVLGE